MPTLTQPLCTICSLYHRPPLLVWSAQNYTLKTDAGPGQETSHLMPKWCSQMLVKLRSTFILSEYSVNLLISLRSFDCSLSHPMRCSLSRTRVSSLPVLGSVNTSGSSSCLLATSLPVWDFLDFSFFLRIDCQGTNSLYTTVRCSCI